MIDPTPLSREAQVAATRQQMVKCLDLAIGVFEHLHQQSQAIEQDADGLRITSIDLDELTKVLRKQWDAPINDKRLSAAFDSLAGAVSQHGMTQCGVWTFAHLLHHDLYDDL